MIEMKKLASRSFSTYSLSSSESNIFKDISKRVTHASYYLNRYINSKVYYSEELGDYHKLTKFFPKDCKDLFDWELYVHKKLYKNGFIPPLLNVDNFRLTYNMKDLISLRLFFSERKNKIDNSFINELISFVINLNTTYYFVHDSLTIDTVFVRNNTDIIEFYMVEFESSKINVRPFKSTKYNYNDLYSLYYSIQTRFPDETFTTYFYVNLPYKYTDKYTDRYTDKFTDIISCYTYN